jgi:hypothetical protein
VNGSTTLFFLLNLSLPRNTKLIHIGSAQRLIEMTEVNSLSPFQVTSYNKSQKYNKKIIAGNAIVINSISGREVVGYVVDECINDIHIKIDSETDDIIVLKRPESYNWDEYHPIRMKIMKSGKINFTINRIHINKDTSLIIKV